MKITKVKWNNHPILGNLELNFTNQTTNLPYDNIVLVGENGVGKSTILETISSFLNIGSIKPFEYIEYITDNTQYKAEPIANGNPSFHKRTNLDTGSSEEIRTDTSNSPTRINDDNNDVRHVGCILSRARAEFSTKKITGVSSTNVDGSLRDNDTNSDFTNIKQLLVDINSRDYEDFGREAESNPSIGKKWDSFYPNSRMYRFKEAFNNFFESIKFQGIKSENSEKRIVFEKYGKEVDIDNLSTGEKQIVFRGANLLRNLENSDGGTIFIDEPELSMHPLWQKKILPFFKDLFKTQDGQRTQMFFATHSELVLESALSSPSTTLIIVLKDNNGTIVKEEVRAPFVLPVIQASEVNFIAYNMPTIEYHNELYGYIQSKAIDEDVKNEKEKDFENWLVSKGLIKSKRWTRLQNGNPQTPYEITLHSYIRNTIHHPENSYNQKYSDTELLQSIQELRNLALSLH